MPKSGKQWGEEIAARNKFLSRAKISHNTGSALDLINGFADSLAGIQEVKEFNGEMLEFLKATRGSEPLATATVPGMTMLRESNQYNSSEGFRNKVAAAEALYYQEVQPLENPHSTRSTDLRPAPNSSSQTAQDLRPTPSIGSQKPQDLGPEENAPEAESPRM